MRDLTAREFNGPGVRRHNLAVLPANRRRWTPTSRLFVNMYFNLGGQYMSVAPRTAVPSGPNTTPSNRTSFAR